MKTLKLNASLWGILLICSFPYKLNAQQCPCLEDLNYVVEQIEQQHPGRRYFKRRESRTSIAEGLNELRQELTQSCTEGREACVDYLNRYFTLIPDRHLKATLASREDRYLANPRPLLAEFEILPEGVARIEISSFNRRYTEQLDSFYRYLAPQLLNQRHLIVDVQNNGGGAKRNLDELLKLLKDRRYDFDRVALLQSGNTGSAAEHFLLRMRRSFGRRLRSFGANSYGALAYGGTKAYQTPQLQLHFRIPRVVFKRFRRYEVIGVAPDVATSASTALEQALEWLRQ
ncbi:MAG: S41 family peptidase [Bacteroidota bacterium]